MFLESRSPVAVLTPQVPDVSPEREALIRNVADIYPYVQGKHGIDFVSIIKEFEMRGHKNESIDCTGGSGQDLIVELGNQTFAGFLLDLIEIKQGAGTSHDERHLEATLNLEDNTLTFDLRSKALRTRELHPDFFAGKFINFAIKYFEQIRGRKIKNIKNVFFPWSDNYEDFFEVYNKRGKDRRYQQKNFSTMLKAQKNTWATRVCTGLGFDQIDYIQLFQKRGEHMTKDGYQIYSRVESTFSRKEKS